MSSRVERAVSRLKRLAAKSSDGDSGMSVNSMIEAVVGPGYDQELEALVSMALSSSSEGMDLRPDCHRNPFHRGLESRKFLGRLWTGALS